MPRFCALIRACAGAGRSGQYAPVTVAVDSRCARRADTTTGTRRPIAGTARRADLRESPQLRGACRGSLDPATSRNSRRLSRSGAGTRAHLGWARNRVHRRQLASDDEPRQILRLAMNAYYHAGPPEQRLGVGHTVPIGESWTDGSQLDHLLVSTPYPFGPGLEWCNWDGGHEAVGLGSCRSHKPSDYKVANGLEALERRFDEAAVHFLGPAAAIGHVAQICRSSRTSFCAQDRGCAHAPDRAIFAGDDWRRRRHIRCAAGSR